MNARTQIALISEDIQDVRRSLRLSASNELDDPVQLMRKAGIDPDPWQADLLRSDAQQTLLLCTRQGGKSTTTAGLALYQALTSPGSLSLLLSPSLRQSSELFAKVMALYTGSGSMVAIQKESALRMELINGSRVIALPGTERTIRGYSGVDLLIIDEASRVEDDLYLSVRPMLAVSGGRLIALTTPWGKRGWFFDEWTTGGDSWKRIEIPAPDCPRISKEFLDEERRRMPAPWFVAEYMCEFTDTIDAVFSYEDIQRSITSDVKPLFELQEYE